MASAEEEEKERAVFDNGDGDGDGDDSEEEEEEEDDDTDDDLPAAAAAAAAPRPPGSPVEAERHTDSTADADDGAPTTSGARGNPNPNPNPNRGAQGGAAAAAAAAAEEARRLFQRLWTEEEELVILRGFSEFTTRRGTAFASHQYDTGPFYDEMRRQLPLDFSKSQLVEKLRRLKKKYLNCVARLRSAADSFAFRSPHEQALFEIARNIWTPSSSDPNSAPDPANPIINHSDSDRKPPRLRSRRQQQRQQRRLRRATAAAAAAAAAAAEDPIAVPVPVPITVTAENPTPKPPPPPPPPPPTTPAAASDLLPLLFKELVGASVGGPLLDFGSGGGSSVNNLGDGRWRKQQILELEVYLKRLELLREHIESTLRDLKGSSGGA